MGPHVGLVAGPAPWRHFILVRYVSYTLGQRPGAVSYLLIRLTIRWAGSLAPFHMLQYLFHTLGLRLAPFDTCSICVPCVGPATWRNLIICSSRSILSDGAMVQLFDIVSILWAGALAQFHICSMLFPYFGPAPWCSFIFVRYVFVLRTGPMIQIQFFEIVSILWAGALAQIHTCSTYFPLFGLLL